MLALRSIPAYIRHAHWYVPADSAIPLVSNLEQSLPLSHDDSVLVHWPREYAWKPGTWRLAMIRQELERLVPVRSHDVRCPASFRSHGGFPLPQELHSRAGQPGMPKDHFDIRGEYFGLCYKGHWLRCAYDYSDYPVVSTETAREVDLYFKCVVPRGDVPANVVSVGYFPRRPALLAKARRMFLTEPPCKNIDVYARFGGWTDSQDYRVRVVRTLQDSSLAFTGGFGTKIYPAYMREMARARVAIEAPGQGPLSYRLAEAMALGAVVVCAQPKCRLPEMPKHGVHLLQMRDDASDLVERCSELLDDEPRRKAIAANALAFFDLNFSPQSIARRIVRACAEADTTHGSVRRQGAMA